MKRTIKFLLLIGFFLTASPNTSFAQSLDDVVYVCLNQGKKYHVDSHCRGLGNCQYSPTKTTVRQAVKGMQTNDGFVKFGPCKICSKRYAALYAKNTAPKSHTPKSKTSSSKNKK